MSNMNENFNMLFDRIEDTIEKSNLIKIKEQLESIKGNTIVIGAGGSSVVANFASKIIKPDGIVVCKSPRDLNYENIGQFKNIFVVSYSGKGYVIENALNRDKNVYLLTNGDEQYKNVETIKYDTTIEKEDSFISLASTLMPMSILYHYYQNLREPAFLYKIKEMFEKIKIDIEQNNFNVKWNNVYEILGGTEYSTAIKYLETTLVESGIAIPIIHDKYDYCHGRTTTSYKNNNGLIYFDSDTEYDKQFYEELKNYYTEIVKIEKYYKGNIINSLIDNDYYATIKAMYLTKMLAENKGQDISDVDYSPLVRKLYYYKGDM